MDMIKVGPAGKEQYGTHWDEKGRDEVAQIFVSYNHNTIYSLQFLFYEKGKLVMSNKHGINECETFCAVTFDYPTEFLTSISGSFRTSYGYTTLSSISFRTNKGPYGPFGTTPSADAKSKFTFQIGDYPSFGGFHGSKSCHGIESFGVYMKPITTSMIHFKDPPVIIQRKASSYNLIFQLVLQLIQKEENMDMIKVGPVGEQGQHGTRWDEKGRNQVAQIFVSYNHDTIYSLQFLFYENGKLVMSNKHGINECESFCAVTFDYPTEFLTSVSGSFQTSYGYTTLSSISLRTNKGSYGPFGTTPSADAKNKFTFQIGNYPSFGGFHGSKSCHGIESFGVYMKPITTSMIHFNDPTVRVKKEGVQEKKV